MDVGSKVFGKEDKQGNQLLVRGFYDENKQWTHASVHLKLAKLSKPRLLGYVDVQDAILHVTRDLEKHYHYKSKGFGFNWELLNGNLIHIKTISLRVDDDKVYVFPKTLIKEYGTFLNFKQQGFELQRFLRFDLIKKYEKITENDTKLSYVEIAQQ
ncbi:hypothetical protein CCP3SC1AL1_240033 [Gammaproteobacteria bacterium]|jgi:hypothetical protein